MNQKNKRITSYFIFFSFILILGVIYAILQANLQINGITKITQNSWNVHFDNIVINPNSVPIGTGDTAATIDPQNNCKVDFSVTLSLPGDFYEFTVDVENDGSIDAMIGTLAKTLKVNNVEIEVPDYLNYTVTYEDGVEILENHMLAKGTKETYKVRLEFKTDIDEEDLPDTTTLSMSVEPIYIQADNNAVDKPITLYGIMKNEAVIDNINSTYVQNETPGIDFTKLASDTNGKGTYLKSDTANNTNPIYYYRGAVLNNNVLFGNLCWKIIRTTDTGGIKMIYNGVLHQNNTDTICGNSQSTFSQSTSTITLSNYNETQHDAKYSRYTYDNNGVETDSTIKTIIDTWYQDNLLENYDSYIEDTIFCNDHSAHNPYTELTSEEKTAFYVNTYYTFDNFVVYGPMYRILKKLGPSLSCPNKSDSYTKSNVLGNGKLTYPIALLTSDEMWLVGSIYNSGENGNRTYFLAGSYDFYTMSPSEWGRYVENSGYDPMVLASSSYNGIASFGLLGNSAVRPAISLKPGTVISEGDGSAENPYIVE